MSPCRGISGARHVTRADVASTSTSTRSSGLGGSGTVGCVSVALNSPSPDSVMAATSTSYSTPAARFRNTPHVSLPPVVNACQ